MTTVFCHKITLQQLISPKKESDSPAKDNIGNQTYTALQSQEILTAACLGQKTDINRPECGVSNDDILDFRRDLRL